jgi:hypothetical protein
MVNAIGDVISVLLGLCFVTFCRPLAERAAKYQQNFWGANFGVGTIKGIQIGFLLVGIFFIIFGLLSIFHIV